MSEYRSEYEKELYEILHIIVSNAKLIPDQDTNGLTDCYSVPMEDIECAMNLLKPGN